jgi:sulfite reductase beta subunit-like hemoprotein
MQQPNHPNTHGRARLSFASEADIDEFVATLERYERGELTPDEWRAFRLVRGTYGQRQAADAQMLRVKVPQGVLTSDQLVALADVSERYSRRFGHITTRQNIQLHFVKLHDAEPAMRRLAEAGLTTREACGNSVRNVTACPYAGVAADEAFDVTPYAEALTRHLLRHPMSSSLPRKFKIAFEGCPEDHARTPIHDIGAVAAFQEQGGVRVLGFKVYVGGGLGAAPMQAILLEPFTPAAELLRTCEAAVRVHDRLGDRKNKATARIKFVVKRLGPDAFRKEVFAEREQLPRYTYPEMAVTDTDEQPPVPTGIAPVPPPHGAYPRWRVTNVITQKQAGYSAVIIKLQLGDITSAQMRALASIIRRYCGGKVQVSIEQNLLLRWVRNEHLAALYTELAPLGLAEPEANLLRDVTSCPGAETCQLGISASRGLARALEARLKEAGMAGPDIERVSIKVSGCPNSCGQHHIADIGFFGGARKINEHLAPHFQLMLGGMTAEGVAQFGQPVVKLPARRIPDAVVDMLQRYRQERASAQESFRTFAGRVGLEYWKQAMAEFTTLPAYESAPEAYRDWGAEAEFSLGGMGPGECAA